MAYDGPLAEQYKDASNLDARTALHARFGTDSFGWFRWVFEHLRLPEEAQVLEVGCGSAKLWRENAERIPKGWQVTLTDASPGMVTEARRNLEGVQHPFPFAVATAETLPFEDAAFDAVVANHMLYHVPDLPRALTEVRRVLRPGGHFFASTNGEAHMRELDELSHALVPGGAVTAFAKSDHLSEFRLETGAALLEPLFTDVMLHRAPQNDLYVTEAEPLVAYALSVLPEALRQDEAKVSAFRREVQERIAAAGGIHITRSSGLFVAR